MKRNAFGWILWLACIFLAVPSFAGEPPAGTQDQGLRQENPAAEKGSDLTPQAAERQPTEAQIRAYYQADQQQRRFEDQGRQIQEGSRQLPGGTDYTGENRMPMYQGRYRDYDAGEGRYDRPGFDYQSRAREYDGGQSDMMTGREVMPGAMTGGMMQGQRGMMVEPGRQRTYREEGRGY